MCASRADPTLVRSSIYRSISKVIGNKRMRDEDGDSDDGRDAAGGGWSTVGWMGVKYSARVCLADFL